MPPRRSGRTAAAAAPAPAPAPAAPSLPLKGCIIAISGTFDQKRTDIESFLVSLGAVNSATVTRKVTQLISTPDDLKAVPKKVALAQKNGIPIVGLEWAQECEAQGSKVAEDDFVVSGLSKPQPPPKPQKAPASAQASKKNGAASQTSAAGKKRSKDVAQSDDDNDVKPQPKKQKAATTGAKRQAAASADDADDKTDVKTQAKADTKKAASKQDKAPVADGQLAKSSNLFVPLDEGCKIQGTVYIAPDGMIYDASLNQTNATNNNNKFYRVQVVQAPGGSYNTWTRWGRVGESGQNAVLGNGSVNDAIKQFKSKFKAKSGLAWENRGDSPVTGKYTFVERSYESDSEDEDDEDNAGVKKEEADEDKAAVECTLSRPVAELMGLIFNLGYFAQAMSAMNYDANKLPLGKLSKSTITKGFQALKDLSAMFNDPSLADSVYSLPVAAATEQLSNTYYSLIPHAFGRNRPPVIGSPQMLKAELELLDSLSDMKVAADLMKADKKIYDVHPADSQFRSLNMDEMTALDHKSSEFTLLSQYLNESKGSTHGINYKVQEIFRIERNGELARFQKSKLSIKSDRRLLWHGSRVTNFGGILSQGLRIAPPEAPSTGYMFGKGIYLADMSTKSANYCNSYSSNGEALLLLCEAELGDPIQKLTDSSYTAGDSAKANGMLSTWGQGSTGPLKWQDASCVHESLKGPDTSVTPGPTNVPNAYLQYNEYIVYDVAQVRLRYLFRVKM
ncbi:Poly [ADP-ribose] polymerase 2 [Colletotrichum trifolii]|uniref:Poly [ADP-ribose] polymerase n=1 Tax=Colletotrichum trifolii TaxID=5466 RepID=A0A4R8QNN3_COLTR|nr:Poly [ADP-ribose] polymerase 2 [Colletotrichum trifolii]